MSTDLTPRDYAKLLTAHDPSNADPQPEANFWRKCKTEGSGPNRRPVLDRDKQPIWLTPPIIRHTGVQMLAVLFGVQMPEPPVWPERNAGKCAVTCEVRVTGYEAVSDGVLLALTGVEATLSQEWPVRKWTMQIGEVNSQNGGVTGRQYPQIFAYKRAYDRAVLDHLLIFGCYGDVEAPEFAQHADYEATHNRPAAPPVPTHMVANAEWGAQGEDIRKMARDLMQDFKVPRQVMDQLYRDVAGEAEPLGAALLAMLDGKLGMGDAQTPDKSGGQDDGD